MKKQTEQSGFTLVELAIVLVIIGLIVGGVLVGADLIKAATQQKAVKQIADTEAGATTFRVKYNDLPGDLRNATSVFPTITGSVASASAGEGNGDGLIQGTDGTAAVTGGQLATSGETAVFFPELSLAGYVKEAFATVDIGSATITQTVINSTTNTGIFQPSALGKGAKLAAGSDGAINYIVLFGDATGAAVAGVAPLSGAVTPLQASNFDTKLDDGVSNTGNVKTMNRTAPVIGTAEALSATACANTGGIYNSGTTSTTTLCNLSFRGSF